jgi:hypothetical protein
MERKITPGWGQSSDCTLREEGLPLSPERTTPLNNYIMFNAFGNMTVVAEPVQETPEAWIFTHYIVDLQTGASAPRQWREGKRSRVDGNLDAERKDAIRFNRGQSKNIRNVIVNRMPFWLTQKVIEEAKHGARDRLQKYIDKNGLAAAQTYAIEQLKRYGVTEAQVLEKMGKAEVKGLDLDDLVMLKSDLVAIEGGEEYASTLFPSQVSEAKIVDLKDKLKAKVGATTPAAAEQTAEPEVDIQVRTGAKPFTWFANDGISEYLVSESNGVYTCNCQPKCTDCAHVAATQRFAAQP